MKLSAIPTLEIGLAPDQFHAVFPFHFAVDSDLRIVQVGASLARYCPEATPGALFKDVFQLIRPDVALDHAVLMENQQQLFLLLHPASSLRFRGQLLPVDSGRVLVFLVSPWLGEANAIARFGLNINDFPIHDPGLDLLHIVQAQHQALADSKELANRLTGQRAELRAANERLRDQDAEQRKLALIAALTTNAVVLTDARGRIEWVNDGFTRLTGYSLAEVRAQTPGSLLQAPETNAATVELMRRSVREGVGFSVEILNQSRLGRKYWITIEAKPIRNDAGEITHFMAIQSDITARKEDEDRIRNAMSELERVNRVMMNREHRVLELKHEVNELCREMGRTPLYPSAASDRVPVTPPPTPPHGE